MIDDQKTKSLSDSKKQISHDLTPNDDEEILTNKQEDINNEKNKGEEDKSLDQNKRS